MPFFCTVRNYLENSFEMINILIGQIRKIKRIQKVVTLQVRIPLSRFLYGRKRVSFSASASMTVEAALGLPLFLFAGVVLMMPIRILDVERQVQAHVEAVGDDISQAAYFSMENVNGKEILTTATAYGYAEAMVRSKLRNLPIEQISLASSELLLDGETVDLIVDYEMQLPFAVLGLKNVERTSRCYRRAWIGKEGIGTSGNGGTDSGEEIVYVGKHGSRYHRDRACHYLYNKLEAVRLSKIEEYRNLDGRRYTPCSRCGKAAGVIVYIMSYGEHYHSSGDCTAIRAYVSAVPISQVEHLGPCSYCSGGS